MTFKIKKMGVVLGCLAIGLSVGACSLDSDTQLKSEKIQLVPEDFSQTVLTDDIDSMTMSQLSTHYDAYGDGGMNVTITYDPQSKVNTAREAASEAARISSGLKSKGVDNVNVDILPVNGQGDISNTLIGYGVVTAKAPEGCYNMGGMGDSPTQIDKDYKLGCTLDAQIAQQVARPKDLAGNDGMQAIDGRRAANVTTPYKFGIPNEQLEGQTLSE